VTVRPATTDDYQAASSLLAVAGLVQLDPLFAVRPQYSVATNQIWRESTLTRVNATEATYARLRSGDEEGESVHCAIAPLDSLNLAADGRTHFPIEIN
jgi:hypothetical protein